MSVSFTDPEEQRLKESYLLECKVLVKDIGYIDEQSKGNAQCTDKMVFLVPKQTTQMEMFFRAWLPEDIEGHTEITMVAGHPIYGYFRGAVQRRNKNCADHHIFVMSRGAEEDLKMLDNKLVQLEVLPSDQEHKADFMRDFTLTDNRAADIVSAAPLPTTFE